MYSTQRCFLISLILLAITGCSSSGDNPVYYYLIEPTVPISPVDSTRSAAEPELSVQIVDLVIPQYLERFQIITRRPGNQLSFSTGHQWAESLRKNLSRTLARNLSSALGTDNIGSPSNRLATKPTYRLSVFLEKFERDEAMVTQLVARWQLMQVQATDESPNALSVTHTTRLSGTTRANDYPSVVRDLSELFANLSVEISAAIKQLEVTDSP